jgi:hypothetical protein
MTHHATRLLAGVVLLLAIGATSAQATPVLVKVRVEGPTSTLYESWISTDVRPFHFTGDADTHVCDGTSANPGGTSPTPVVTRGSALAAAIDTGLSATGSWSSFGPSFNTIAGQNVAYNPSTNEYLVEYDHGTYANVGACADPVTTGEEVLFAYGDGTQMALSLTAPANVNVNEPAQFVVRNSANNVGQSGATVGGVTSDAGGVAMLTFPSVGSFTLKAEKAGTIRSNAVTICVHNGNDGNCGYPLDPASVPAPAPASAPASPAPPAVTEPTMTAPAPPVVPAPPQADTQAPIATIAGVRNRQHFRKHKGPRELRGSVSDTGGLKSVELRLRRQQGKRCFSFSAQRERFTRIRCSRDARWFGVGSTADWSYLLPKRLPKGLYQLQVRATDAAGNRSTNQSVRFRVA